jgi:hypothetical protein
MARGELRALDVRGQRVSASALNAVIDEHAASLQELFFIVPFGDRVDAVLPHLAGCASLRRLAYCYPELANFPALLPVITSNAHCLQELGLGEDYQLEGDGLRALRAACRPQADTRAERLQRPQRRQGGQAAQRGGAI